MSIRCATPQDLSSENQVSQQTFVASGNVQVFRGTQEHPINNRTHYIVLGFHNIPPPMLSENIFYILYCITQKYAFNLILAVCHNVRQLILANGLHDRPNTPSLMRKKLDEISL